MGRPFQPKVRCAVSFVLPEGNRSDHLLGALVLSVLTDLVELGGEVPEFHYDVKILLDSQDGPVVGTPRELRLIREGLRSSRRGGTV